MRSENGRAFEIEVWGRAVRLVPVVFYCFKSFGARLSALLVMLDGQDLRQGHRLVVGYFCDLPFGKPLLGNKIGLVRTK